MQFSRARLRRAKTLKEPIFPAIKFTFSPQHFLHSPALFLLDFNAAQKAFSCKLTN